MKLPAVPMALLLWATICLPCAEAAAALPSYIPASEAERVSGVKTLFTGRDAGMLLTPAGDNTHSDDRLSEPFHELCGVYAAERQRGGDGPISGYTLRFQVHAPDAQSRALLASVSRLLLILHGEIAARFRAEHPSGSPVVSVWLSERAPPGAPADVGGEQFRDQIYLYNILDERAPIEWAREVSHEYGHFALSGVTGYTSPEEWANGVLGERLFLSWLREAAENGLLPADRLPFVTAAILDAYWVRQVAPLMKRLATNGVDLRALGRKDAAGMDSFTGLALYMDAVYGSHALYEAFAYSTPQNGSFIKAPDFYRGVLESLAGATELTLADPLPDQRTFMVYLPAGDFEVAGDHDGATWRVPDDARGIHRMGSSELVVNRPDWCKLTLTASAAGKPVAIRLTRRSSKVE